VLTLLIFNEHSIIGDRCSSIYIWLLPWNFNIFLTFLGNVEICWLRDAFNYLLISIRTIERYLRSINRESLRVSDSHSLIIDSLRGFKTESNPKLFFKLTIVEWHVNLINSFSVPWREYLDICNQTASVDCVSRCQVILISWGVN